MKKKRVNQMLAMALAVCMLVGCGGGKEPGTDTDRPLPKREVSEEDKEEKPDTQREAQGEIRKPLLLSMETPQEEPVEANAPLYDIAPDLSNVENLWQFYFGEEESAKLAQNGFVVQEYGSSEFFEVYEENRYLLKPNFVTVDSMMHTYHLYFSYLMKNIERDHLADALTDLSARMLEDSAKQYESLKGTQWEEAAARNVAFFEVGARLSGADVPSYDYAEDMAAKELAAIDGAAGIEESSISGELEDYSQYVPRGYYEGDEQLERYFKTMMWYGRMHFLQKKEELDRSALLMTMALSEDTESYDLWESIYAVTSFFAGASDDAGVCEYAPLVESVYGESASTTDLVENPDNFDKFHALTAKLTPPQINSIPIWEGKDNVILGFRFMGQRFTIDASIMQNLIFQNVREDAAGNRRMLPDVLDVPAALGSEKALEILEEQGDTAYAGYPENMEQLKENLSSDNQTLWHSSLYANWLNTLRPLLTEKGEGYPIFMQNEEWTKKNLECFAGSFSELKHDTVLYTKQVMAEMGGGMEEEPDDRGYVEPEPIVFERFNTLASETAKGLKKYGMLGEKEEEDLMLLAEMGEKLAVISRKELRGELPTEEEFEFIRTYGGNLEHFWLEAVKNDAEEEAYDLPISAAVVTDIATDPNGQVLEIATGNPSMICVVVEVDGAVKIAVGSVYKFYQFPWDMSDRLTDSKWRYMMGYEADENGNWKDYMAPLPVEQPEWTQSYRISESYR